MNKGFSWVAMWAVLAAVKFLAPTSSSWGGVAAAEVKGVVSLDQFSFEKIVESNQFYLLVKFDKTYAFGEKEDEFKSFVKQIYALPNTQNVLVGSVSVQEYGERKNLDLASDFDAEVEAQWPTYRLFVPQADPIAPYEDWAPIPHTGNYTAAELLRFVRGHAYPTISISLPGCLESLDKLAYGFLWLDDAAEITSKLQQAEAAANVLASEDEKKPLAEYYVSVMKGVLKEGPGYVTQEGRQLLHAVTTNSVGEKLKAQMILKLNILAIFQDYRCEYGGRGETFCLYPFDKLTRGFSALDAQAQAEQIELARRTQAAIADPASQATAEIYVKYMQKVRDQGVSFLTSENQRLSKVMGTPMSEAKWLSFKAKRAILHTFLPPVTASTSTSTAA